VPETLIPARTYSRVRRWHGVAAEERVSAGRDVGVALTKRIVDVVGASLLLVVLLPVWPLIGAAVKLSSPGPILFAQVRVGKDGVPFTMYKFRTMRHGSDPAIHHAYVRNLIMGVAEPIVGTFKLRNDPRVTRVGRVLRHFSLDELPQVFNVLKGEMSLVGPRPPLPYEVEAYSARDFGRLAVAPGLTGLWQVSGRSALTFRQMVELDLEYVERWSVWLDVQILLRTPWAVLTAHGAC
jgi:lipopolysaccharide/colanic/teichoic acid biosynthesis glycosyltransferase